MPEGKKVLVDEIRIGSFFFRMNDEYSINIIIKEIDYTPTIGIDWCPCPPSEEEIEKFSEKLNRALSPFFYMVLAHDWDREVFEE